MTLLDGLMTVNWFFGLDVQTASFVIAALGVIHPMFYTCIFFIPMTYLLLTIWVLVVFYSGLSLLLFHGLLTGDEVTCRIWIWYSLIFVILMVALMYLHFIAVICKKRCNQMTVTLLGILWYMATIYFILVVNSYRKTLNTTYILMKAERENGFNSRSLGNISSKQSTRGTSLNTTTMKENETLNDLKNIIEIADNTVSLCKTNLTNLMSLFRDKQIEAKKLLDLTRLNIRKETKKLIDILFVPDKLNETRRLINMSIISDIENEIENLVNILDSFPFISDEQHTIEDNVNYSNIMNSTPSQHLEVTKTESPLSEVTMFYIENSPDDGRDLSSRLLLQDEEKKKRDTQIDIRKELLTGTIDL